MNIGNYKVIRKIGEGGFAKTYEAMHRELKVKACLKQNINITPDDLALLKDEARLLWDIHHYALPTVKDFFTLQDGSAVLAMSFIEGKNLDDLVKAKGPIHPEDVCWITQRVLQGLHYLHAHGIVHSDVKPQNVIPQPKYHNAVLVDFGLSIKKPKSTTKPTGYTEAYASPELLQGLPPLPESDFYGLGLVMMYALGGDPFGKSCPASTPKQLAKFIDALVCYDPKHRPRWEKVDLVAQLSDIRQEVFGRRHSS